MLGTTRNWRIYGVLAAVPVALSGCGNLGQFDRYREDFRMEKPFEPNGRLEVENFNGSVDIASWPRNSIEVSGTKSGPSRQQLDQLKINVRVEGGVAYVDVEKPGGNWSGGYGAKLRIRVPRQTTVTRVKTTNAGVGVEDVEGGGAINSTNGRVLLQRVKGDYTVETSNGGIELDECEGAFRLKTTNGPVRGSVRAGSVNAETSNGGVDLTVRSAHSGEPVRAVTRNGSIVLALSEFNNNAVSASTSNGGITLRLPESVNAQLDAETSIGTVQSDFSVGASQSSKHSLSGTLGAGGPAIDLHTNTGSIHIQRF